VALADDELVVERLADVRRATRQRVWDAGGASPVLAAAQNAQTDADSDLRLYLDADATLITCWCDDRHGRRRAAPTFKKGWGRIRW
jgi:hypothetical protein